MFLCEECMDKEGAWPLIVSGGMCEGCGKMKPCADFQGYKGKEIPPNSTIEQIDKVIDLFFSEYKKGTVSICLYELAVKLMNELKIERGE